MKITVLDIDNLGHDLDWKMLSKFGCVVTYNYTDYDEIVDHAKNSDILIFNKIKFDENILSKLPNLKLLCVGATGYDNIDIDACKRHSVALYNVCNYSTRSVTFHTFAMLFKLISSIDNYDQFVKSGKYSLSNRETNLEFSFEDLGNKNWGIIGLGNIGKSVASVAKSFGCNVSYYSTSGNNDNSEFEKLSLHEILTKSDILSIHCPKNEKTVGLIGKNELKKMKKSAVLINVGRGGIVDEKALADALNNDEIAGCAVDVFENEPIKINSPLRNAKNSVLTPHVAWSSLQSRKKLLLEIYKNIDNFLSNNNLNRIV